MSARFFHKTLRLLCSLRSCGLPQQSLLRCVTGGLAMDKLEIVPKEDFVSQVSFWAGAIHCFTYWYPRGTRWGRFAVLFTGGGFCAWLLRACLRLKPGLPEELAMTTHLCWKYCWPALLALQGWDLVKALPWDCDGGWCLLWVWGIVGTVQEGDISAIIHLSDAVSVRRIRMLSTYQKYRSPLGRAGSVWPQKGEVCPKPQGLGFQSDSVTKHRPSQCKVRDWRWITLLCINFLFLHKKGLTKFKKKNGGWGKLGRKVPNPNH